MVKAPAITVNVGRQGDGKRTVLWWGHFDPEYSRNRILRQVLANFGWSVRDFRPRSSALGDLEATLRGIETPALVWVPCFRQRDIVAAHRWARRRGVPLLVDPLISAYDKQVFERRKFNVDSGRARRLLTWERRCLGLADRVLADTVAHAEYFSKTLQVSIEKIQVVPVGAEEGLFSPGPWPSLGTGGALEILFFGSFIPLQGPRVIIEAARCYRGPAVRWVLVGDGPLLAECRQAAADLDQISFEPWVPYQQLPCRISQAHILLGIFGATPKASRVIPNKVYQAAACARPVVTLHAQAYPAELIAKENSGFFWVPPGDPVALAAAVADLASDPWSLPVFGAAARQSYEAFLSVAHIEKQLVQVLIDLGLHPRS
ncbi:hypothetical protein JCM30471_11750 [Desulfuromonas carbonis]